MFRSPSLTTLSETMATDSSNSAAVHHNPADEITDNDRYLLVSCRLNADQSFLNLEKMPVDTPAFIQATRETSPQDLHFLQWVFTGYFEELTAIVNERFPGYRVLRAEGEPGISWEDYRTDRRSLLVWLIRSEPDMYSLYQSVYYNADKNAPAMLQGGSLRELDPAPIVMGQIAQQMAKRKHHIRQFYKELELSEARLDAMWTSLHHVLSLAPQASADKDVAAEDYPTPTENNRDGSEWSVVEDDEDDEPGPHSASEEYESD